MPESTGSTNELLLRFVENIATLTAEVKTLVSRFDKIDARQDQQDARYHEHTRILDRHERAITDHEERITVIESVPAERAKLRHAYLISGLCGSVLGIVSLVMTAGVAFGWW